MKHSLPLVALCAVAFAANADPNSGGFKGPDNLKLITVAEAIDLPEDTHVKLVGYIVKSLGDEAYEFKDDTGTLVVEIDDDDWHGAQVGPTDRVELAGEIDREWRETGVDVDSVRLAQVATQ